jgi:hypothetical protein
MKIQKNQNSCVSIICLVQTLIVLGLLYSVPG